MGRIHEVGFGRRTGGRSASDDEPLMRPNVGRGFIPRRHREDAETMLDGLEEDLAVGTV